MSKTNTAVDISYDSLNNAVSHFYRDETLNILKNGAIKQLSEEEKNSILKNILGLRDKKIIDQLVKDGTSFPPEMFELDLTNNSNREIVDYVFSKYRKNLELDDKENCERFFELACQAESVSLLTYMITNSLAVEMYSMLAAGSIERLSLVSKIKKTDLTDDVVVELFEEAALSNSYKENIDALIKKGLKITTLNSNGYDAITLATTRIENTNYSKNRAGEMKHRQEQNGLTYLKKATKNFLCPAPQEKKGFPVPVIVFLCVVVFAAACITTYVLTNDGATSTASTTETSDVVDDTTADTTADTDLDTTTDVAADTTATSYSTDTSLVVADGDTVNIDYTGYIDGEAFSGGSTDGAGADLVIGSGTYIDDFEEQLEGHNVGDQVEVNVTFPDDYGQSDLAGKDATFDVTINGIYE